MMQSRETQMGMATKYSPRSYGWRLHAGIIGFGLLIVWLDTQFPGWGESILASGAGVGVTILALRRLWTKVWFWIVMVVVIALHVPVTISFKPLADRFQFIFALPFAIFDFVVLMLVFNGIFPKEQGS